MIVYDSQDRITLFSLYLDSGDKIVISTIYKDDQVVSNICTTYDKDGNVISKNDLSVYEQQAVTSASLTATISNLETESLDGGMMLMMVPTAPQATSEEFTYDHLGNRYQYLDKEGYTTTITHNAVNQYQHLCRPLVFGLEDNVYPSYDDNGNLYEDGLGYIYRYDYRNRLIKVEDYQSNVIAEYTYDALGRRIAKTVGSSTTYFYYNTSNEVIAEYENTDTEPKREFVYGNGLDEVLCMFLPEYEGSEDDFQQFLDFCAAWMSDPNDSNWDNSLDVVDNDKIDLADFAYFASVWNIPSNTESHYYYLHDALGSVRGLIGGKYNRQEDREFYNYDVYGKSPDTSAVGNPYMFAGYRHDSESGLYNTINRSYEPQTGRWIQFDPIGYKDSFNLYEYVKSNPINYVDPFGLALYAVGGTWEKAKDKGNVWRLFNESSESPKHYWKGPGFTLGFRDPIKAAHGRDSKNVAKEVKNQICDDFCKAQDGCKSKDFKINMVGWSRGATIVMEVAKELETDGCKCGWWFGKRYKPVAVNWIGLFDAVEMIYDTIGVTLIPKEILPGDNAWPDSIPSNVNKFAHARKTEDQFIFPTTNFGGNEKYFYRNDGSKTDHGDIGNSVNKGNNDAYEWIKGDAKNAGVNF